MNKKLLVILIIIFLSPLVFPKYFTSLLEKPLSIYQEPISSDIIIVHGGGTTANDKLPLLAQQRINQGLLLWRAGLAPQILVTGGPTSKINVEADIMAQDLENRGVPKSSIIEEDKSLNTHENVLNSLKILKENNFKSALIVTSAYHSLRTKLVWQKAWPQGKIILSPAARTITQSGVNPYKSLWNVTREYVALAWYLLRGWL